MLLNSMMDKGSRCAYKKQNKWHQTEKNGTTAFLDLTFGRKKNMKKNANRNVSHKNVTHMNTKNAKKNNAKNTVKKKQERSKLYLRSVQSINIALPTINLTNNDQIFYFKYNFYYKYVKTTISKVSIY